MLTRRVQLLAIALVVVAAYHPVLSAGMSLIDDFTITAWYSGVSQWNILAHFSPSGSVYFRPLIGLSFLVDKMIFGLTPFSLHLENIFLHLVNAWLVFFLAQRILPPQERDASAAPLTASLLFALHPINTESVNWISGRTDVIATAFLISAALLLVQYRGSGRRRYLFLALVSLLTAAFAKETALAFLPGFFLILVSRNEALASENDRNSGDTIGANKSGSFVLLLGVIVVGFIGFATRSGDFISHQSRMAMTLRIISTDWMHTMFVVLRAFGFYMKKLLFPMPLNFAIMEVDPFYEIVAVPLVVLCAYIASRRTLLAALFTSGVILITPAFVLAFGQIAWTPYAERYVYASSAFIIVAVVVFVSSHAFNYRKVAMVTTTAVLATMFIVTLSRGMVWKSDMALARDTVEKSPFSKDMRALYGSLLATTGNYAEAMHQLQEGIKIPGLDYDDRFDITMGAICERQGDKKRALDLYKLSWHKSKGKSLKALTSIIDLLEQEKRSADNHDRTRLNDELSPYLLQLFKSSQDPHVLYRLGLVSADLGQRERAIKYFQQAIRLMNNADPDKKRAEAKMQKLSLQTI